MRNIKKLWRKKCQFRLKFNAKDYPYKYQRFFVIVDHLSLMINLTTDFYEEPFGIYSIGRAINMTTVMIGLS